MRRSSLTMLDAAKSPLRNQVRRSSIVRRSSMTNNSTSLVNNLTKRGSSLAATNLRRSSMHVAISPATGTLLASRHSASAAVRTSTYRHVLQKAYRTSNAARLGMLYQLHVINNAFKKHPLLFGSIFAGVKGVLADLFAQCMIESKNLDEVNWKRNALFGAVGVFYTGFVVYAVYVKIYPKLFQKISHWPKLKQATFKSFVDQFIHNMAFYFPFFYAFKAGVYQGFTVENCKNAVNTYLFENIKDDMITSMSVWGPANIITFAFIPAHLKTPWLSMVSFVWIVVLSTFRGEQEKKQNVIDDSENVNLNALEHSQQTM